MDFTQFNKNHYNKIEWGVNTNDFNYVKISQLAGEGVTKVNVRGLFLSKSPMYGLNAVAILDDCFLSLPTYTVDTVKEILENEDAIKAIKEGHLAISFRPYKSKYGTTCFGITFENC